MDAKIAATLLRVTTGLIMTSIGFVLNLIVFIPNVVRISELSPSSIFTLLLSIINTIMLGMAFTTSLSPVISRDFTVLPDCSIRSPLTVFCAVIALVICAGLSIFRYLKIVHHGKIAVDTEFMVKYLLGSFVITSIVVFTPYMMGEADIIYVASSSQVACTLAWTNTDVRSYIFIFLTLTLILAPTGVIAFCYYAIYITFAKASAEVGLSVALNNARPSMTSRESNRQTQIAGKDKTATQIKKGLKNEGSQRNSTAASKATAAQEAKQNKLLIQSIVLVTLMYIGWLPYYALALYQLISRQQASPTFNFVGEMCVALYDTINPITVMIVDKALRDNILRFICLERFTRN